jgi:hypothetical protein
LQCAHCQCFAFFVDASRSRQKQDFLVKSDTKIHAFDALFSFALFSEYFEELDKKLIQLHRNDFNSHTFILQESRISVPCCFGLERKRQIQLLSNSLKM